MDYKPEPYQTRIKEHLRDRQEALAFVGMSLGKTGATLAAIDELLSDFAIKGVLVVAPLRVANVTWPAEIQKWDQFRWMRLANLRTAKGRQMLKEGSAQIYVINYEMLQSFATNYLRKAKEVPFDVVVWDEISMAKSNTSKRINAVRRRLSSICRYHWGLTGTPASNSEMDLFAQARLVDGGKRLGPSFDHFKKTYFYQPGYSDYLWLPRKGSEQKIYRKISDMTISMKTSDYLDLPDTHLEDVELTMPKKVRAIYQELESEFIAELFSGDPLVAINSATQVGKLLQLTSGAVYKDNKEVEVLHDLKIQAVEKLLGKTGNTFVVYNYRHELKRLKAALPDAVVFAEAKSEKEQIEICDRWNAGKIKTLLVHPQSMSHGLNLQGGGSDIIWVSLTYSRERYDQLIARLVRRGQEQATTVYRLMMKDSIDYAVEAVLRSKGKRQDALMGALKAMRNL